MAVLYVLDPGPDGSMGDVSWIVEARKAGRLPVLIYQGVLQTELSKIADVVLPGAAWVEKDATYTNDQGIVQAASKAINAPGEVRRRLADPDQRRGRAGPALHLHDARSRCAPTWPRPCRRSPEYAGLAEQVFNRAGQRRALAQGQQPDGALEVGHDVPGPAAREGPQRADGADVARPP